METKQTQGRQWVEVPTSPTLVTVGQTPSAGQQWTLGGGWIFTLTANTAVSIDLTTVDWTAGPDGNGDPTRGGFGASDAYFTVRVSGVVPIFVAGYPTQAAFVANPPVSSGWTNGVQSQPNSGFAIPMFPTAPTGPSLPADADRYLARRGINHVLGIISTGTPTVFIYRSGPFIQGR